jgi:hypothetical protein
MHSEDIQAERDGRAFASAHGEEFFRANIQHFKALVTEYIDNNAHEQLDALRERFWGESWVE